MAYTLSNKCAKIFCKFTVLLQLIIKNVVTRFFEHSVDLSASHIFTKFRRSHPMRGDKYKWGIKMSRFSTNKSLYLAADTR